MKLSNNWFKNLSNLITKQAKNPVQFIFIICCIILIVLVILILLYQIAKYVFKLYSIVCLT